MNTQAPMSPVEHYNREIKEAEKRLEEIVRRNTAGTSRTWPLPSEIFEAKFPELSPLK